MTLRKLTTFVVYLLLAGTLATADAGRDGDHTTLTVMYPDNTTYIDANAIFMFVTNHGTFGRDLDALFGYDIGTLYPYTGNIDDIISGTAITSPYYSGGLWIGGIDSSGGDTLLAISEFTVEYVPGPMSGGTFMTDIPEFKVYKLYADSLAGNPNADYTNWPTDQGAPVNPGGSPAMVGDQMLWAVYNDADPVQHTSPAGGTAPTGIEIRQTTFAFDRAAPYCNMLFFRFRLYNNGTHTIENCYVSFWSDADLGGKEDDFVACDTLLDLGFIYNSDDDDTDYGTTPPCLGIDLLQGVAEYTGVTADTAVMWGQSWVGYRQYGMTAFTKYINGVDPNSPTETYDLLRCYPGGTPYTYNAQTLTYMHSGDPVIGSGDLDAIPTDRRLMITTGPITFRPGDSTEIVAAMILGQGADRFSSVTEMKACDAASQILYESAFSFPTDAYDETPPALPNKMALAQNYPNPFNPETIIGFTLPRAGFTEVTIYNLLGQLVATPLARTLNAGPHEVTWNGAADDGRPLASGIYFYCLSSGDETAIRKMVLLK